MSVRVYGSELSQSSLTVVTSGFRRVLEAEGMLSGFFAVDRQGLEEMESTDGASATHGVYTGPLGHLDALFTRGKHTFYWIMLAPNSDRLPVQLIKKLDALRQQYGDRLFLLAPSRWACDVVEREASTYCWHAPHGVSVPPLIPTLAEGAKAAYEAGHFRVMHFSTSAQERKGTRELIRAWMAVAPELPKQAELCLVLDPPAEQALHSYLLDEEIRVPESVKFLPRGGVLEQLHHRVQFSHVVCQPSRGEAFGMVPLEALAMGVPVVATDCTGHSDYLGRPWLRESYVTIKTGLDAPIDDLPSSYAPSLKPDDIADALFRACASWPLLKESALAAAPDWKKIYRWEQQLEPFVKHVRSLG